MTVSAEPGGVPVISSGEVSKETPCRKCGYNLLGLGVCGRCPECGTLIEISVNGDLLRYSDPQFLEGLRRGVLFLLWGTVAVFVAGIGAGAAQGAGAPPVVIPLLGLISSIPCFVGSWLLTEPDPARLGETSYGAARKLFRITTVVDVAISLMAIPLAAALDVIAQLLAGIVGLVWLLAQMIYLRKLAMRFPDEHLQQRTLAMTWAVGVTYGLMGVFGLVAGPLASTLGPPFALVALGIIIGTIVVVVMYLLMLGRFAARLREHGQLARKIWSGGEISVAQK